MRAIRSCLNKQLQTLYQATLKHESLSIKLKELLPAPLAEHCQVGSFHQGCLVLTTDDPAWASQLRFYLPELRDQLRKEAGFHQLTSVNLKLTEKRLEKKPLKLENKLSQKAGAIIREESQGIRYEPLKQALLHLAQADNVKKL